MSECIQELVAGFVAIEDEDKASPVSSSDGIGASTTPRSQETSL